MRPGSPAAQRMRANRRRESWDTHGDTVAADAMTGRGPPYRFGVADEGLPLSGGEEVVGDADDVAGDIGTTPVAFAPARRARISVTRAVFTRVFAFGSRMCRLRLLDEFQVPEDGQRERRCP